MKKFNIIDQIEGKVHVKVVWMIRLISIYCKAISISRTLVLKTFIAY